MRIIFTDDENHVGEIWTQQQIDAISLDVIPDYILDMTSTVRKQEFEKAIEDLQDEIDKLDARVKALEGSDE